MLKPSSPIWERELSRRPYVIAEAGVNHNGSLEMAHQLINAAKASGADCVKFQAYTASELVTANAEKAAYQKICGDESQYQMLKRYELQRDDFFQLQNYAQHCKIDFLTTPFSSQWTTELTEMGACAIKIGSGNLKMVSLLKTIARSGLDVIASTGMCDLADVERLIETLQQNGCGNIAILHCVSLYPTPLDQANLYAIDVLRQRFGLPVGFSDHTQNIRTGGLAVAAGAVILEKHFTLDPTLDGPDHAMSLSPSKLKAYIDFAREAAQACGEHVKEPHADEAAIKQAVQTSLVARRTIESGTIITADMLTEKRPGNGIPSDQLERIIGTVATQDIEENQMLQEGFITSRERVTL